VVAARLAENQEVKILLLEAGPHSKDLENVHMTGGWVVLNPFTHSP
jgi:choline dehydrogenase-like flavoprotein